MGNDLKKPEEFSKIQDLEVEYARGIIEDGLRKVGLFKDDVVLVHADATPAMYLGGYEWWKDACELLKSCLLNVLGDSGTLIVPTFNWDFCNGNPYSHSKTISRCGMFSNNILFDPRSIRSFHPIYSFAGIGLSMKSLAQNVSKSSFGEGSIFERLHRINAKI
jgi:aminoglycoside 3-N-acetyltransferase